MALLKKKKPTRGAATPPMATPEMMQKSSAMGAQKRSMLASMMPKATAAPKMNTIGAKKKGTKALPQYKKGGKVKKTGKAIVHKGERVLNKKQAKKFNSKKFEAMRRKVFGLKKKK